MVALRVPARGDIVWLNFDPQVGHEQAGRRPALILSPQKYNAKLSLALCCPITSQIKGYPFEVPLAAGLPVSGAVLADQVRSLDWVGRNAQFICTAPQETIEEVLKTIGLLL